MSTSISIRAVTTVIAFVGACSVMWCIDRKGIWDEDCCGTTFRLRVHEGKSKDAPDKEVILRLFQGCPGPSLSAWISSGWITVDAKLCDLGSNQCETATTAKIRLESISKKGRRVSGSYSVDFPSAGHEEEKFTVRYHHKGPRIICE